jgi:hypothetical protein
MVLLRYGYRSIFFVCSPHCSNLSENTQINDAGEINLLAQELSHALTVAKSQNVVLKQLVHTLGDQLGAVHDELGRLRPFLLGDVRPSQATHLLSTVFTPRLNGERNSLMH